MTTITRSALVMFSAEQMFDLVNDVRRYPEFLDGCRQTEVIDEGEDFIKARLTIAKAGINQSFSTHNRLVKPERMEMELLDGPFTRFHGIWHFQKLSEEACKVSLDMEFEVANKLTGVALGVAFKQVANMMVDSFVKRAQVVYG
ncbi:MULTISPECIES: type II toxin-antitoxin system RatA family toxin [unclassified Oceanobacter]|uniref:type II toxin-antitoxin system RatA family toxin n=1 Tax=unclassified Oceanobacter TaxID=2620260 RepID=UPI0026E3509B|nr:MULTISPECIES: type II toxin-antitoxin system RatA family toxin [unclassified Oceanobacter]MDO6681370.1 type II toxin-antitoxin system RatA family toxin [Oceanobacter sp. 5_MG-2023]MDP2505079.1 type II toxin-antitoxin system RatA family toxin [Oceanobacter sp. 3_MG-2023]MDP2548203.1 type II toxin-antitoxin system RatA family toxin [Oceanobacter sp. 4_MG-2023]MDP2608125.1 type II toxin-antitoxin system RatA family toxin [Oceanobacter sp. 1_MG-2023]MDP2611213.1 type II toxin-antitoxin system R